jgi:hypothetical protein
MRSTRAVSVLAAVAGTATLIPPSARADVIVFQDRVAFAQALDRDPSVVKVVEGWDTYPAGTVFPDGTTTNGITYYVSAGDALVGSGGISLSPPHNLFYTRCEGASTCSFRPLVDTLTFSFPTPIRAFGITFSSTFAIDDGDYLLTTDRGDVIGSFFNPLSPGFPLGQFAGFIADEPFSSVTVSSTVNALYGMDDLVFAAGRDTSPIPSQDNSWETIASPAQVTGAITTSAWPRVSVGLDVNPSRDEARLYLEGGNLERIGGVAIRCGIAGTDGPIVWQRAAAEMTPVQPIRPDEILAIEAQSACGVRINNIASLEAAAHERRLYVEMERNGVVIRGQLGPKQVGTSVTAMLSNQQVVGAGAGPLGVGRFVTLFPVGSSQNTPGPLAEWLYDVRLGHPASFRSVALRCGRAGEEGEIVAYLPGPEGSITSADVLPTQPGGACGMAVTHLASLHEAMLRGNLYVEGLPLDAAGLTLRGQIPATERDGYDNSWEAIASTAQAPGAPSAPAGRRVTVGLGVNTWKEEAALYLAVADIPRIDSVVLRCGIAGTVGPVVWRIDSASLGEASTVAYPGTIAREPFYGGDLIPAEKQGPCGVGINNVASLEAAARERRLYVEIESDGVALRGQLWPKTIPSETTAVMSDQQVLGASAPRWLRSSVVLSFAEQGYAPGSLAGLSFRVPDWNALGPATLYCGRAGQDGEIVGYLNAETGSLTNADVVPTQVGGACGMAVTNVASLLEASLRGNLYVAARWGDVPLRGQVPRR